jgi:pimeloyl-ACP methyl ester carboxylesterase
MIKGPATVAGIVPAAADVAFDRDSGRARLPDRSGYATASDGVRLAFDVYGDGDTTLVLLPSTPIIHSRQWKGQIHYLSRRFRVVAFDGRGNGRSDRPTDPMAYTEERLVGDVEAVMDATDTREAVLVGLCGDGVWVSVVLAASRPERVRGIVAFAVGVPKLSAPHAYRLEYDFEEVLPTDDGWAKVNRHYWQRDYPGFAQFFFSAIATEPHSTKAIDDAVGWAVDGSVDAMLASEAAPFEIDVERAEATCLAVRCPMLLVHGTEDHCQPVSRARRMADLTGAPLVIVEGADHMIPGRHPVLANLLIRQFVESLPEVRA